MHAEIKFLCTLFRVKSSHNKNILFKEIWSNWPPLVTFGFTWSHSSLLRSRKLDIMALIVIMALGNMVKLVTTGHNQSVVVTLITVEVYQLIFVCCYL